MALTTLEKVRSFVYKNGDTNTEDDVKLNFLITQLSGAILDYIQRPVLFRTTFTELRSGVGNSSIMLRNYPVISVSSVTIYNVSVPATQTLGGNGFSASTWDGTVSDNPQSVSLYGYEYTRGRNNIRFVYEAGYCVLDEAYTVTSSASSGLQKYTALQPSGTWGQDDGITYASSGSSLTAMPAGQTPSSAGQYSVTNGIYQFTSSDAGASVLINYSYTPAAVEQACIMWVAERYRYLDRIGQKSKSLSGNETTTYDIAPMPGFVKQLLNPYAKWLPL